MDENVQLILETLTKQNEKLDELLELYEKELQRQVEARDLETTKEAERVKLAEAEEEAKKADEALKAEELVKEKQEADSKTEKNQEDLLSSIGAVEAKLLSNQVVNQQTIDELSVTNQKLSELIEIQTGGTAISASTNQLGTMAVSALILAIGAYAVFKAGGFVVSKITQILW